MTSNELQLFELLKIDEGAGTIHFEHRRKVLLDADAHGIATVPS